MSNIAQTLLPAIADAGHGVEHTIPAQAKSCWQCQQSTLRNAAPVAPRSVHLLL
jgi:hypothetical protein